MSRAISAAALLAGMVFGDSYAGPLSCVQGSVSQLMENGFVTTRRLDGDSNATYEWESPGLKDDLRRRPNTRWFDGGIGDGNALVSGVRDPGFPGLKTVGVAAELTPMGRQNLARLSPEDAARIHVLHGRYLEDIPEGELARLGSFDVITDIFGPLAYTVYPHEVLNRYFRLAKPGGVIRFSMQNMEGAQSRVFLDWLKGIDLKGGQLVVESDPSSTRVRIVMPDSAARVEAPPLFIAGYSGDAPPLRSFRTVQAPESLAQAALRKEFDFARKVRRFLHEPRFQGADPFASPELYELGALDPGYLLRVCERWHGKKAKGYLDQVSSALGERFTPVVLDPGVATRLDEFFRFARTELQRSPGLSPFELRQGFASRLGKRKIYYGRALSEENAASVAREGFVPSAMEGAWSSSPLQTGFSPYEEPGSPTRFLLADSLVPVFDGLESARNAGKMYRPGAYAYRVFEVELPEISVLPLENRLYLPFRVPPGKELGR